MCRWIRGARRAEEREDCAKDDGEGLEIRNEIPRRRTVKTAGWRC